MVQQYSNHSMDTPLETQFFFPVDIDYTLSKIRIDYENLAKPGEIQTVETAMEERKVAETKYEDAITQGDKLAILTQYITTNKRSMIMEILWSYRRLLMPIGNSSMQKD